MEERDFNAGINNRADININFQRLISIFSFFDKNDKFNVLSSNHFFAQVVRIQLSHFGHRFVHNRLKFRKRYFNAIYLSTRAILGCLEF